MADALKQHKTWGRNLEPEAIASENFTLNDDESKDVGITTFVSRPPQRLLLGSQQVRQLTKQGSNINLLLTEEPERKLLHSWHRLVARFK